MKFRYKQGELDVSLIGFVGDRFILQYSIGGIMMRRVSITKDKQVKDCVLVVADGKPLLFLLCPSVVAIHCVESGATRFVPVGKLLSRVFPVPGGVLLQTEATRLDLPMFYLLSHNSLAAECLNTEDIGNELIEVEFTHSETSFMMFYDCSTDFHHWCRISEDLKLETVWAKSFKAGKPFDAIGMVSHHMFGSRKVLFAFQKDISLLHLFTVGNGKIDLFSSVKGVESVCIVVNGCDEYFMTITRDRDAWLWLAGIKYRKIFVETLPEEVIDVSRLSVKEVVTCIPFKSFSEIVQLHLDTIKELFPIDQLVSLFAQLEAIEGFISIPVFYQVLGRHVQLHQWSNNKMQQMYHSLCNLFHKIRLNLTFRCYVIEMYQCISSLGQLLPQSNLPLDPFEYLFSQLEGKSSIHPKGLYHLTETIAKLTRMACSNRKDAAVQYLSESGLTPSQLENLPIGVACIFYHIIEQAKSHGICNRQILELAHRKDYARTFSRSVAKIHLDHHFLDCETPTVSQKQTEFSQVLQLNRFDDLRVEEVCSMLCSSEPKYIKYEPNDFEENVKKSHQECLLKLSQSVLALPSARGILCLSSITPILTDTSSIPDIRIQAYIPPRNALIKLDLSQVSPHLLPWPQFHNSCAEALSLSITDTSMLRAWISLHKGKHTDGYVHGGFLLGLGIRGHLNVLSRSDMYGYLALKDDPVSIGLLLGSAASFRGTCDATVSKLLCVHLTPLLPPGYGEIISPLVQTAALLGLGLLYEKSGDHLMSQVCLSEISREPDDDVSLVSSDPSYRKSYSLVAGMALGLINVGRGSSSSVKRLYQLDIQSELMKLVQGGSKPSSSSNLILEPSFINTQVTAPGAIIALALIYLKTGTQYIADQLSVKAEDMDSASPTQVLLRVLASSLILWDDVERSVEWVEDGTFVYVMDEADKYYREELRMAHWAGKCLAIGLRYASTNDETAVQLVCQYLDTFLDIYHKKEKYRHFRSTIDMAMTSCCVAISLVMAGSGDLLALRRCRAVSMFFKEDCTKPYGYLSLISISIAMLFMGGCRHSFDCSTESIAILFCALLPIASFDTWDHSEYFQPLRHLLVLAAERQFIETRDVDSDATVSMHVDLYKGENCTSYTSPCLLPSIGDVDRVILWSKKHLQMSFTKDQFRDIVRQGKTVFVQESTPESSVVLVKYSSFLNTILKDLEKTTVDDIWNLKFIFAFFDKFGPSFIDEMLVRRTQLALEEYLTGPTFKSFFRDYKSTGQCPSTEFQLFLAYFEISSKCPSFFDST